MAFQGELLQLTDVQQYLGQEVLNVYYYRVVPVTGIADAEEFLASQWIDQVLPAVCGIQCVQLRHKQISVRNLSDGLGYWDETLDVPGSIQSGTELDLPSYVAVNYKLVRESLATRNGSKRFAGVPESVVTGNTWTLRGGTLDNALAQALAADIIHSGFIYFEPIIVKRPIVPPVGTGYVYSSIGAAQFTALTTQNTRKSGRGR